MFMCRPQTLKTVPALAAAPAELFVTDAAEIVEAIMKVHQYGLLCAPTTAQYAALEALERGEPDVQRMLAEYARRRAMFVEGLNRIGLSCPRPQGAFYAFPSIKASGLTSDEFAEQLLYKERVAVVLRAYAYLPDEAIAAAIGCRPAAVDPLVRRGLDRLRKEVQA